MNGSYPYPEYTRYFPRTRPQFNPRSPYTSQKYLDKSPDVIAAKEMYNVESLFPSQELANKTGCKIQGLWGIIQNGQKAYYAYYTKQGIPPPPGETPYTWGWIRLAKAITGKYVSLDDYRILEAQCSPNSKALTLTKDLRKIISVEIVKKKCADENQELVSMFYKLRGKHE